MRIFIGQVPLKLNITHGKYSELFHVEREILEVVSVLAGTLAMLMGQVPFTPLTIVTFPSHSVAALDQVRASAGRALGFPTGCAINCSKKTHGLGIAPSLSSSYPDHCMHEFILLVVPGLAAFYSSSLE